ncbi:MAG: hypothetical protein AB1611_07685 [bacterium]
MSQKPSSPASFSPLKFEKLRTKPLAERKSKVRIELFAKPGKQGQTFSQFLDGLPRILAGQDFLEVIDRVVQAVRESKGVVLAMGAHVIKCGLSPVVIDLMQRGVITGLAFNGAGIIHDYELAIHGQTSEDVDQAIVGGEFGMAEETGRQINQAINEGVESGLGLGESIGKYLVELNPPHVGSSLLAAACRLRIPATVHIAIGTDIIHMHPEARPDLLGQGSMLDFRLLCSVITSLHQGGVYFNIGSAVILPEVFLKALTLVRNLGYPLRDFTTVNLDFIQHYRPNTNVVRRPIIGGGKGYSLTGHHEIMIPLLAAAILERLGA